MQPLRRWTELFEELLDLRSQGLLAPTQYVLVELRTSALHGRYLEWSDGMTIEDAARSDAVECWLIEPPFMWHEDLPMMLGHVVQQARSLGMVLLAG